MIRLSQSIRWRIQAWHALILLFAIAAFCAAAYQLAWQNQMRRIDREIRDTERTLVTALSIQIGNQQSPESPDANPPILDPDKLRQLFEDQNVTHIEEAVTNVIGLEQDKFYFAFFDADGRVFLRSDNGPIALPPFDPKSDGGFDQGMRDFGNFRENTHTFPRGLRTVVGRDIRQEIDDLHRHGLTLAGAGFTVWAFGLLGGWWLTGKAIRPIKTISETASRIASGNLKERIQISHTSSELGQLSQVLNDSFDRLQKMFDQQRQFTGDASHELRTPLTILLSESQRMQRKDIERSPQEYRASFELCYQTASRMQHLVENLLLLARQDTEETIKHIVDCPLHSTLKSALDLIRPLAIKKSINLQLEAAPLSVRANPQHLEIIFNNLIGNAVRHHPGQGTVEVKLRSANNSIELDVIDDGNGIPPKDLPHIFDRFYRVDSSRHNTTDPHSGLGLAIVKSIIDMMNATIAVQSSEGQGTTFTVTFPTD